METSSQILSVVYLARIPLFLISFLLRFNLGDAMPVRATVRVVFQSSADILSSF